MTDKKKFQSFKQLYQDNKFDVLLKEDGSVYWLKLRSISRKELMIKFCQFANIDYVNVKTSALFEHIYNNKSEDDLLNKFIMDIYQHERSERKLNETVLISELYKMKIFDWGGLYQNNLERTIVDSYIKKIKDFELLNKKIENEIHTSVRGYVHASWYNHWTSILIEDIFKDNKKVSPTVGLIKKVDFFIDDVPFDLKVTYFPDGYMIEKRKAAGLPTEIQAVKQFAKMVGIDYNKQQKNKVIFAELMTRFRESTDDRIKIFLKNFNEVRWRIIQESMRDYKSLIRWLYEEQGERRFDAANRLFLVLIDKNNLEESWKMKRNIELLRDKIANYLDSFSLQNIDRLKIEFNWLDGKKYMALSDVIFIVKEFF